MKKKVKLTPTVKKIRQEIEEITKITWGSMQENEFYKDALKLEKENLIKIRIISDCTLIEELMSLMIMNHILKDSDCWNKIKYFGRIKRFSILYDEVLGRIPPFQKLDILKQFSKIPHKIESTTRKIFNLRNVFAHTYTLDYKKERKILYDGVSIVDLNNFKKYWDDSLKTKRFFIKRSKVLYP